ncbi:MULTISPECIES: hypothetical protein [Nostocales]|jgi:hypothetical protein|uniref:Uncharacterized protein n=1 Tax=Dolichospermum flos-aquae UHCC 0037 TaxID=2590026 RepID=A0ACC7S2V7_DOLFA|nr:MULTISPECIES: hypothetical protein [Nostocales]MTJ42848.1 hypothetical protein [Dolichospermum flos-aquae UHCC 0037]
MIVDKAAGIACRSIQPLSKSIKSLCIIVKKHESLTMAQETIASKKARRILKEINAVRSGIQMPFLAYFVGILITVALTSALVFSSFTWVSTSETIQLDNCQNLTCQRGVSK